MISMEKVLIDLFVPAIEVHFDVFIPTFLHINTIIELLGKAIENMSNGEYVSSGQELLCSVDRQQVLNFELTLRDYDVKNGESLMLC